MWVIKNYAGSEEMHCTSSPGWAPTLPRTVPGLADTFLLLNTDHCLPPQFFDSTQPDKGAQRTAGQGQADF
jgi:hypothetical protein